MAISFSSVKSITIPEGEVKQITDSSGNVIWKGGHDPVVIAIKLVNNGGPLSISHKIYSGGVSGGSITISPSCGVGSKTSTYASYTYSRRSTVLSVSATEATSTFTTGMYDIWYINNSYPFQIAVYGNTGWGTVSWTISPISKTSMSVGTWYYFTLTPSA